MCTLREETNAKPKTSLKKIGVVTCPTIIYGSYYAFMKRGCLISLFWSCMKNCWNINKGVIFLKLMSYTYFLKVKI